MTVYLNGYAMSQEVYIYDGQSKTTFNISLMVN